MNTQHGRIRFLVVDIVGDSNDTNRQQGIDELVSYRPAAVVPTLIEVLLDRGRTVRFWDDVVEGVCRFLWDASPEYVLPCAPALVYLLAVIGNVTSPDPTFLIDALDLKVETQEITYAIPVLLELVTSHTDDEVAKSVQRLLSKFSRRQMQPYQSAIDDMNGR